MWRFLGGGSATSRFVLLSNSHRARRQIVSLERLSQKQGGAIYGEHVSNFRRLADDSDDDLVLSSSFSRAISGGSLSDLRFELIKLCERALQIKQSNERHH